jgi:predicted nucleotidyltransferase
MKAKIAIPEEAIRDFCRRWQVGEFTLFESVLRDDFGADSDIDVLISFRPETQRGFTQLAAMRKELEKLWGRRVDLVDRRLVEVTTTCTASSRSDRQRKWSSTLRVIRTGWPSPTS